MCTAFRLTRAIRAKALISLCGRRRRYRQQDVSSSAYVPYGAVLCCAVLCCAVLCWRISLCDRRRRYRQQDVSSSACVPYGAVLCCAVRCCVVLCCAVLCCADVLCCCCCVVVLLCCAVVRAVVLCCCCCVVVLLLLNVRSVCCIVRYYKRTIAAQRCVCSVFAGRCKRGFVHDKRPSGTFEPSAWGFVCGAFFSSLSSFRGSEMGLVTSAAVDTAVVPCATKAKHVLFLLLGTFFSFPFWRVQEMHSTGTSNGTDSDRAIRLCYIVNGPATVATPSVPS